MLDLQANRILLFAPRLFDRHLLCFRKLLLADGNTKTRTFPFKFKGIIRSIMYNNSLDRPTAVPTSSIHTWRCFRCRRRHLRRRVYCKHIVQHVLHTMMDRLSRTLIFLK